MITDAGQAMKLEIDFKKAALWCLQNNVPYESQLHRAFESCDGEIGIVEFIPVPGGIAAGPEIVMCCTKEQAEQLLEIAKKHCPDAVYPIQQALAGRP